jgi:hypothetical protein
MQAEKVYTNPLHARVAELEASNARHRESAEMERDKCEHCHGLFTDQVEELKTELMAAKAGKSLAPGGDKYVANLREIVELHARVAELEALKIDRENICYGCQVEARLERICEAVRELDKMTDDDPEFSLRQDAFRQFNKLIGIVAETGDPGDTREQLRARVATTMKDLGDEIMRRCDLEDRVAELEAAAFKAGILCIRGGYTIGQLEDRLARVTEAARRYMAAFGRPENCTDYADVADSFKACDCKYCELAAALEGES